MNSILFVESITIEVNSLFEECDRTVAYANARFLESENCFFIESSESGGGLVGFLKRVLGGIRKLVSDSMKKLKSILFGAEVKEECENEKIEGRDVNALTKFVNGYYKDASDVLKKAKKGELSVEDAKRFTEQKDSALSAIGTVVTTVGALVGGSKLIEKTMGSWNRELDEMYNTLEVDVDGEKVNLAHGASLKYTKTASPEGKKDVADQAVKIITNHMSETSKGVLGMIFDIPKKLYAKNYVKARLERDEERLTTKKGQKEMRKEAKERVKSTDKEVARIEDETRRIRQSEGILEKISASDAQNKARKQKAASERYTDVKGPHNKSDLTRDNYTTGQSAVDATKAAAGDIKAGVQRMGRSLFRNNKRIYGGKKSKDSDIEIHDIDNENLGKSYSKHKKK